MNDSIISDEEVNQICDQVDEIIAVKKGEVVIPFEDKMKLINYCKTMHKYTQLEQEMISAVADMSFITTVLK